MIKAILIDDVTQARAALAADIRDYCPEVQILGEADGVGSGLALIRQLKPDLIFLDIRMNDGTGFDLLEQLGAAAPRVIFTTAYDDQAIRAFKFSAVDYLLKPVDPEELKRATAKLAQPAEKQGEDPLQFLMENFRKLNASPSKKIVLNTQEKMRVVQIEDILHCESDSNYTVFYLNGKEKLLVTRTLGEFEELLQPHHFFRVHHSHLVNLQQVKEFVKGDGGYLVMNDGSHVPVSTRRRDEVLRKIQEM